MIKDKSDIQVLCEDLYPVGMRGTCVDITIQLVTGFELQNTRPYHNYETWSQEWRVYEGSDYWASKIIRVAKEDLNDALQIFAILKRERDKNK